MTFRRRTYPEVLDNILTGLVQGVAAETHPYPPAGDEPFRHILEHEAVATVVSVYGSRNSQPHRFTAKSDYLAADKTITWLEKGDRPDPGTLVSINYLPANSRAALTDIYPGSVLRTISETIALEIARLYAQLEAVYDAGFIDSAAGSALDRVVALLDVQRITGNHPVGMVLFTRAASSRGVISIPAGTRISTEDGKIEYETTETVTLLVGQQTVRARAQDVEPDNTGIEAGLLIVLPVPIAGIGSVTNPEATSITAQAESDDELRQRSKSFLAGSERATVGALKHAIERQGVSAEIIENSATPGIIQVNTFSDNLSPELEARIKAAIADARPAGVFVNPPAVVIPGKVALNLRIESAPGLLPPELRAIQSEVREKVAGFFAALPAKSDASLNKLVGLVLGVSGVEDMQLLSATLDGNALDTSAGSLPLAGQATVLDSLNLVDPALPAGISVVVAFPENEAPPDSEQLSNDMANTIAYLNTINGQPGAPQAQRTLSWQKALLAITLPGKPATSLQSFDQNGGPLPADAGPYTVIFTVTQESGLTQILSAPGDAYILAPFEQLSLHEVTVTED